MSEDRFSTTAWPTDIRYQRDTRTLEVEFDIGETVAITAELLRVESPSAEVQGHGPTQKKTVGGKRLVDIREIEPVGNYAIRIVFDDGHDTGLYTWRYLRELGTDREKIWGDYVERLAKEGLSRDA